MPGVCLRSWCASLTTAFPFSSSSPTFNSPTPGVARPITSLAYTEPRCAKPTSSRASQSTLAPPSMTSTGWPAVGNGVPIAARYALMHSQQQRRGGHDGAGVPGRDEGVGLALLLEPEPDPDGGTRLALDRGERLLAHPHDLRGLDEVEPGAVDVAVRLECGLDVRRAADQLDAEGGRQLPQRLYRPFDHDARGVVAAHRIQRDADHVSPRLPPAARRGSSRRSDRRGAAASGRHTGGTAGA